MSYTTADLNYAIYMNSSKMLNKVLSGNNGTSIINNTCSMKNTLNKSIRSVLGDKNLDGFSLKIIKILLKNGAMVTNSKCENDTLHCTLICSKLSINSFTDIDKKLKAEKNAIEVIELMIKNGAEPIDNPIYDSSNTLSTLINIGNQCIIKSVIQSGLRLKPDNSNFSCNTFECALIKSLELKNLELLRIALKFGALPNQSAMSTIIEKCDPMLIQELLIVGGKQVIDFINQMYHSKSYHPFPDLLFSSIITPYIDSKTADQMIEVLMCSGITMQKFLVLFEKYHYTKCDKVSKLKDCYYLLNHIYLEFDNDDNDFKRIRDLKQRLINRMDQLVNLATLGHVNRKSMIENTITCIPICCTDIIYEYQIISPKFDIIDWSKY